MASPSSRTLCDLSSNIAIEAQAHVERISSYWEARWSVTSAVAHSLYIEVNCDFPGRVGLTDYQKGCHFASCDSSLSGNESADEALLHPNLNMCLFQSCTRPYENRESFQMTVINTRKS